MITLIIEDKWVQDAVAAFAKRAKYYEGAIEANGYGNLAATADVVKHWQEAADAMWALVRKLGETPDKFPDEPPFRIIPIK